MTHLLPLAASKFRSDTFGDVLWFAAPGAAPPSSSAAPDAGATHSLEYLYWRAMQKREGAGGLEGDGAQAV